jgi:hypothetical protein
MASAVSLSPESKHDVLLQSLRKYYASPPTLALLTRVLRNEAGVSLRIIDWLVTNYAKKHNICYLLKDASGTDTPFNVFMQYKAQLKAYSKKYFDPFSRRERLDFADSNGQTLHTTCGQLNFFRWGIQHGVIQYAVANAASIEHDMMASIRHRYPAKTPAPAAAASGGQPVVVRTATAAPKARRKELSKAAIKTCTKTKVHVVVRFS